MQGSRDNGLVFDAKLKLRLTETFSRCFAAVNERFEFLENTKKSKK